MLIILLICWLLIEIANVDCAPKLGYLLYNALKSGDRSFESKSAFDDSSSSDGYLFDDSSVPNLRSHHYANKDGISKEDSPEHTKLDGYIFDENICKYVNGRLLCGYDKNKGVNNEAAIIDLGNGCRIRRDRIECGYVSGPFTSRSPNLRANLKRGSHNAPTRTANYETNTEQNSLEILEKAEYVSVQAQRSQNISEMTKTTDLPTTLSDVTESRPPGKIESEATTVFPLTLLTSTTKSYHSKPIEVAANLTNPPSNSSDHLLDESNKVTEITNFNNTSVNDCTNKSLTPEQNTDDKNMQRIHVDVLDKRSKQTQEKSEVSETTSIVYNTSPYFIMSTRISKVLRENRDKKSNVKRVCVEQKDRIVCYDYQTI